MCLALIVNLTFSITLVLRAPKKRNKLWMGLVFEGEGYQITQNVRS